MLLQDLLEVSARMAGGMLCNRLRGALQVPLGTRLLMRFVEACSFGKSKRSKYHIDSGNYPLLLIYASIKSMVSSIKLQ
jgi:hypothetical protein